MGLRPSSKSNPSTVSRFLDTGYDNVKKVADNIEDIGSIASSIDIINQEAITQVEVIGQGYVDQAEAAKIASEQAASDSQGYSVTAINAKNESIVQVGIATDKANEALQSANESASQASIATTQANLAISSANAAATSESNALSSSNLAESWATNGEDILVDGTEYSSKHYSIKASASAAQASLDAQTISDQLDSTYLKTESDLRYLQITNNLNEVDPIQSRNNLELGTAATKNVGSSTNEIPDKAILDTRLATTGNLGDSATKNIGSNAGEVPDKSVLDTRLGTTGNLGTAATKDVGEAAGNVMEVGAFGLGSSRGLRIPDDDANSLRITGIYSTPPTWIGSAYAGASSANQGTLHHSQAFSSADTYAVQTFIPMVSVDKVFFRRKTNSVWSPWQEIYHTGNILGTVSQSGGVPTGAIIESGNNANGSYVKYADGTMICSGEVDFSGVIAGQTLTLIYTHPSLFSSLPEKQLTAGTDFSTSINKASVIYDSGVASNTSQTRIALQNISGATTNYKVTIILHGRWY